MWCDGWLDGWLGILFEPMWVGVKWKRSIVRVETKLEIGKSGDRRWLVWSGPELEPEPELEP